MRTPFSTQRESTRFKSLLDQLYNFSIFTHDRRIYPELWFREPSATLRVYLAREKREWQRDAIRLDTCVAKVCFPPTISSVARYLRSRSRLIVHHPTAMRDFKMKKKKNIRILLNFSDKFIKFRNQSIRRLHKTKRLKRSVRIIERYKTEARREIGVNIINSRDALRRISSACGRLDVVHEIR